MTFKLKSGSQVAKTSVVVLIPSFKNLQYHCRKKMLSYEINVWMQGGQTGKPLKGYLKSSRSVPLMQATAILRERRCTPRSLTLLQSLTQTHPRIPRGGQSGREKRRDKSLPWVSEDDPNLLSQRRSRRANFSPPTPPPPKKKSLGNSQSLQC